MPNEISLSLNQEARDVAMIYTLLFERINYRILKQLYLTSSGFSIVELEKQLSDVRREELAWIFQILGEFGKLDAEGLDQLLSG